MIVNVETNASLLVPATPVMHCDAWVNRHCLSVSNMLAFGRKYSQVNIIQVFSIDWLVLDIAAVIVLLFH